MGAWEGQEDLVGVEGRKTTIRIYFMKRIYFQFFFLKKGICNANKCGKEHGNA